MHFDMDKYGERWLTFTSAYMADNKIFVKMVDIVGVCGNNKGSSILLCYGNNVIVNESYDEIIHVLLGA